MLQSEAFISTAVGVVMTGVEMTGVDVTYSTVGRSIASISDLGSIFTSALRTSVNMAPRTDILAIDLPTVLAILRTECLSICAGNDQDSSF